MVAALVGHGGIAIFAFRRWRPVKTRLSGALRMRRRPGIILLSTQPELRVSRKLQVARFSRAFGQVVARRYRLRSLLSRGGMSTGVARRRRGAASTCHAQAGPAERPWACAGKQVAALALRKARAAARIDHVGVSAGDCIPAGSRAG
jgi:hypothetical protein